jgi:hypothetical protein
MDLGIYLLAVTIYFENKIEREQIRQNIDAASLSGLLGPN